MKLRFCFFLILFPVVWGCSNKPVTKETGPTTPGVETSSAPVVGAVPAGGGIPVPADVRQNLGITFARVERRAVANSIRLPGAFEWTPEARQEYRVLLGGRVRLGVQQFEEVAAGDLLMTLDSPEWRQLQHEAVEAEGDITMSQAQLDVARAQRAEAQAAATGLEERLERLSSVKVRRAELEVEASALRNRLPALAAEVKASEAALAEANEHYLSRLRTLSSVTGISVEELRKSGKGTEARWRTIDALEVHAQKAGVVESLNVADGGWLEQGELALTTVEPTLIRFRAAAPQADLAFIQEDQPAHIVPPQGSNVALQAAMTGTIQMGLSAEAENRTLSLFVVPDSLLPWAKAGVSGYLEIAAAAAEEALAIPQSAIVRDGTDFMFFRRNPRDPDKVLAVKADIGPSDGRWTMVKSGVKEGDEVVVEGAYSLKLAGGSAKAPEGYHYHADGSLHKNH